MTYATYPSLRDRVVLVTGAAAGSAPPSSSTSPPRARAWPSSTSTAPPASACARRSPRAAATGRSSCTAICATSPPSARRSPRCADGSGPSGCSSTTRPTTSATRWTRSRPSTGTIGSRSTCGTSSSRPRPVYPDMAAAGGGAIVNLGSTSWMVGQGGMPGYTAAEVGGRRADARPRARPRPAWDPRHVRRAGVDHDRAADQALAHAGVGGRAAPPRSASSGSSCPADIARADPVLRGRRQRGVHGAELRRRTAADLIGADAGRAAAGAPGPR